MIISPIILTETSFLVFLPANATIYITINATRTYWVDKQVTKVPKVTRLHFLCIQDEGNMHIDCPLLPTSDSKNCLIAVEISRDSLFIISR